MIKKRVIVSHERSSLRKMRGDAQEIYLYIINYEILRKHTSAARRQHGYPKTEKGYK